MKNRQMPENPTNVMEELMKTFIDVCENDKENIPVEDAPNIEKTKVTFTGKACQINIPREWLDEMGISPERPEITLLFDGDSITAQVDFDEE